MSFSGLSLLPHAVNQPRPQLVQTRVCQPSTATPLPVGHTDPIYVENPAHPRHYWMFESWPSDHGDTLPAAGATVLIAVDHARQMWIAAWEGNYTAPGSGSSVELPGTVAEGNDPGTPASLGYYEFPVPAVASYSISHMLGRWPIGPTFYDAEGNQDEVGFQATDMNTLVVSQGTPVEGMVVFA